MINLVELSDYQREALRTRRFRADGPEDAVAPMLGLASETGSILSVYKKYLREGIDLEAHRDFLREELGDLLWYLAAVASTCGLDLDEIAETNLRRTQDRYTDGSPVDESGTSTLPRFDASHPETERFPSRLVFQFTQDTAQNPPSVVMKLVHAEPNAFPKGIESSSEGKKRGFELGKQLGNPLSDNTRFPDAYRFHDAIHVGFVAVLGWSPTLRGFLGLKRKSDPATDEAEDGARAVFAEEGLAAVLAQLSKRRTGFSTETSVDGEVLDIMRAIVADREVAFVPAWLWRRAIGQGFAAMRALEEHDGGYLVADLDKREVRYSHQPPTS